MLNDAYATLVRRVLYPTWERRVRRRPTLDRLAWLERVQWASLDELLAIQRRELVALVHHAYHDVPFYRRQMQAAGAEPGDITGPDDLRGLPLLTRRRARESYDERRARSGPAPVVRKTTGGTTGEPLVIRYDLDSEYWRQAIKLRAFGWAGYRVGAPSLHYWGEPTRGQTLAERLKIGIDRALKREHYVDCTPRGTDHLDTVVELIRAKRPRAIFCYAQAGADLARHIIRTGARDWGTIPVICGAERVMPDDRRALEGAFGPAVFETYGCREVMLIGAECECHEGLHLSLENLVVEVLVTEAGRVRPARPGETGEVVLTDLHNLAMPLIRYANGDVATYLGEARCACGRRHPRLAAVEGRSTETLRGADGARVGGMVFNLIFSPLAEHVRQFQAVQHPDDSITVRLVPGPGFDASVLEHLQRSCRRYLPGVPVRPEIVSDIPLSRSGKRRIVVVEQR